MFCGHIEKIFRKFPVQLLKKTGMYAIITIIIVSDPAAATGPGGKEERYGVSDKQWGTGKRFRRSPV